MDGICSSPYCSFPPVNPGAVDEIIHFGNYLIDYGIMEHRDSIIKVNCR